MALETSSGRWIQTDAWREPPWTSYSHATPSGSRWSNHVSAASADANSFTQSASRLPVHSVVILVEIDPHGPSGPTQLGPVSHRGVDLVSVGAVLSRQRH